MTAEGNKCSKMLLTPSTEKFGIGGPEEYWVLGDIFLQNWYSIYDYPNGKMGLVAARRSGEGPKIKLAEEESAPQPVPDAEVSELLGTNKM